MYESPLLIEVGSVIELTLGQVPAGLGDFHSGQGPQGSPGQRPQLGLS